MSERCPLEGTVWDKDIPQFCRQSCGAIWECVEKTSKPTEEVLDKDCNHDLVHEDSSLTRGLGRERVRTILLACIETGDDVLSESYRFICPQD